MGSDPRSASRVGLAGVGFSTSSFAASRVGIREASALRPEDGGGFKSEGTFSRTDASVA